MIPDLYMRDSEKVSPGRPNLFRRETDGRIRAPFANEECFFEMQIHLRPEVPTLIDWMRSKY
jgi:hypothetical protein